ncbi:unnamed protein product [Didymodactylos carnosus]|uniref:G-patch domain-containing protein n=1 Tax=Didymodactylos carnosus TaxID=1234261 RepID=A0A814EX95_9BILA|nr:unnamed protein product [Didymodactylos carnosus]CAF0978081.1 unnamed protein product [Didymodactylos carnosus]CAF3556410.1 unnamed protein product [Didymodactylos carnosus]CAF3750896.1 unnamed protein product [Didymodactylos carnosus]
MPAMISLDESIEPYTTVLISSIPKNFRSCDLRNFFSLFVETNSFKCFHYRHRPMPNENNQCSLYTMCFVQIYNKKLNEFIRLYHRKHWLNSKGNYLSSTCLISNVKTEEVSSISTNLIELKPPKHVYPKGNVGTPTMYFLDEINNCRLPATIIKKLGLVFPKCRGKKKYSMVGYDYGNFEDDDYYNEEEYQKVDDLYLKTGQGHDILSESDKSTLDTLNSLVDQNRSKKEDANDKNIEMEEEQISATDKTLDDEEDGQEEWDRHETLHDDVTKQDRTSPYFFDHEIELQWEKGGSGLVFYTDEVFWKEHEGKDFDADTADDWDIDTRIYYESAGSADRDGNELYDIRREEYLREGHLINETDPEHRRPGSVIRIGAFEKYTKGVGRRVMEKQGWKDGEGLGSTIKGIPDALTSEGGKKSRDKTGLGYYGEKVERGVNAKKRRVNMDDQVRITTIYDDPNETDPKESINRRWNSTFLKHRTNRKKNVFAKQNF